MGTSGRIRHETYVQVGGALEVMQVCRKVKKDGQRHSLSRRRSRTSSVRLTEQIREAW